MAEPIEDPDMLDEGEDIFLQNAEALAQSPEYKAIPASQNAQSDRYHKRVELYMKMSGLEGISPDSKIGQLIATKISEFEEMSNKALPKSMETKLVQLAVETEILKNAAMSWMLRLRPPKENGTEDALAFRQAYGVASASYRGYVQLLISIMKALHDGDTKPVEVPKLEEKLATMKRIAQKS